MKNIILNQLNELLSVEKALREMEKPSKLPEVPFKKIKRIIKEEENPTKRKGKPNSVKEINFYFSCN